MNLFDTYFIQTLSVAGLKLLVASDQYIKVAQPHLDYFHNTFSNSGLDSMSCGVGMSGILVPGRVTKRGLGVQVPCYRNKVSLCCACEHNR